MRVLSAIPELGGVPAPVSIAIGVFDGVHLGHQALIGRAMSEAAKTGGSAVVLTFHPHPARVLRPHAAPRLLTSTPHKIRLIEALGCEHLLLLPFDAAFAAQPPEAFIGKLSAGTRLHALCVGHQWAFGRNRSGNIDLLRRLGAAHGFESIEIDPVLAGGALVSSTRIRQAVEAGDFAAAAVMLGRDYTILGTVQRGAGVGRTLGFPTANLAAHNEQFPPDGVYAVRVLIRGSWRDGVANVGIRPTVGGNPERLLEVHVFDFAESLYGEDIEVGFVEFLRPEQKFDGLESLRAQIARDVAGAKSRLAR
ncbi:MAG TPA: bifunctional riboflavin kinase/FAD synthetase [Terrimicrobiaceae bacterium]|nr:bifunctional riboflavin kinase/FAD synthetase [Terrimicrobiaceae bacterium]